MEPRNLFIKPSTSMDHLKFITKNSDEKDKPVQIFSDFATPEGTPRVLKINRLTPLDQGALAKRMTEINTTPKRPQKPPSGTYTPKGFQTPQKPWLTPTDDDNTPHSAKSGKKSKFANSLMGSIEQSKQFKDAFAAQISKLIQGNQTATISMRDTPSNSEFAPQQQGEEEERRRFTPQTKMSMSRNLSLPTDKILKRKSIEKGLIISQSKPETPTSKSVRNSETPSLKPVVQVIPYRHLVFGPQIQLETFKKYLMMVHKGLTYATKNLKSPSDKFIKSKQVAFPESSIRKPKTLLLDLDETLIHSCLIKNRPDVVLTYQGAQGEPTRQLPIKIRPYLKEFLAQVSTVYEIGIFTASASAYAKTIVNFIDKDKKYISTILSRENCMETRNGFYIKDLRIIKDRDLKDMIIVDNLVHSFGFQVENGVPILEFLEDKKDEELKYLTDYLMEAAKHDDLREFNKSKLKLREFADMRLEDVFEQMSEMCNYCCDDSA